MKSTKVLILAFLTVSIRQVSGEEDYYDYYSGSGEYNYYEEETVKKHRCLKNNSTMMAMDRDETYKSHTY